MSSETTLKATRRTVVGKQVKTLRREGRLPAIVFGSRIDPLPISLDLRETTLALRGLPSSHLINLEVDGETHTVLLRDKQYIPLKNQLMHLDFQAVSMDEKLTTNVPVRLVGIAPAIKDFDAMLITELDRLEIEAYPGDLPDYIDVDISSLTTLGSNVTVGTLSLGDKVEIRHDPDEVIVLAISGYTEEFEEEEEAVAVEETLEPELITKGKREEGEEEEEEEKE